ncbi:MAG: ABC transporter permease [Clostridia bacterium]|nr:ABC transporter permease [Clostridia bacterium]
MNNERNWKQTLLAAVDTITQPLIAVLISFLLGAVVILVIGKNPLLAYGEMIRGAFGKQVYLMNTLKRATPIVMGGLAVCIAWRSGYEAMGGEGQMILGAMAAALAGYYLPLPAALRIPAALIAAAAVGALYSMFSGWLFEKFDVTFVISTLMLNYIANYFAAYLCNYPLRDPEANVYQMQNAQTGKLGPEAILPPIAKGWVHWGFVLAIVAVLITWFLFKKTSFGFKSRMGGLNPRFALYGGINARKMLYLVMILSGVMAGLGGAFETMGSKSRYVDQMIFSTGYAWTGMVAALLANMNPLGTLAASILLAGLAVGGSTMMLNMDIPLEVCNIIEGIITLFMSARMIRIVAGNHRRRKQAKGGSEA